MSLSIDNPIRQLFPKFQQLPTSIGPIFKVGGRIGGSTRFPVNNIPTGRVPSGTPAAAILGGIASTLLPLIGTFIAKKGIDFLTNKEKKEISDVITKIDIDEIIESADLAKQQLDEKNKSISERSQNILSDILSKI